MVMSALSSTELSRMQADAESSFFDTCLLGEPTAPAWGADPGATSYSYGDAVDCGIDPTPAGEIPDGSQTPLVDAVLRLAIDTTIAETWRVQVTHRHGEELATAETYAVIGVPRRGPSAIVCDLKRVTGESVL